MSHDQTSDGGADESTGRRLLIAFVLNVGITVAELVGGLLSGSLVLLSDAAHNASDAASLAIAWGAERLGQRPANARYTFGYGRAKTVGALVNLTTLYVIALYLVYAGIERLVNPVEGLNGTTLLVVGAVAFAEDLASVLVLRKKMEGDLGVKAVTIHLIGDTLATVGVIASGALILWKGIAWVDPAVTLAIAAYLLVHATVEMREVVGLLMGRAPDGLDLFEMVRAAEHVEGVVSLGHVHAWSLDEDRAAVEARVRVDAGLDRAAAVGVLGRIREVMAGDFDVHHVALELAPEGDERPVVPDE